MARPHDLKSLESELLRRKVVTQDGCWIWTGGVAPNGYGQIGYKNQNMRVHRVAAFLWLGLELENRDQVAMHKCENKACFNPEHLKVGTQSENMVGVPRKSHGFVRCKTVRRSNDS